MKTIPSLIKDEHQAVRDYGQTARKAKPPVAKVLRHIQNEERQHARELRRVQGMKKGISNLRQVKSHG